MWTIISLHLTLTNEGIMQLLLIFGIYQLLTSHQIKSKFNSNQNINFLQLREVVLQEGGTAVDRLSDMKTGLEQNSLRFSLGKGLVTGVCPEASEPTWSLNMKRAILSSLQNSMPDFQATHSTTEVGCNS